MAARRQPAQKPARLCRTAEECWQAGWDDAADMPPLTHTQVARLTVLLRPYLRRQPADPELAEHRKSDPAA